MQNLLAQQSSLPAPHPQQIRANPVPFPRIIFRPPEAAAPSPVSYIPQPTPCRPQVPPKENSFKPGSDLYQTSSKNHSRTLPIICHILLPQGGLRAPYAQRLPTGAHNQRFHVSSVVTPASSPATQLTSDPAKSL